MKITETELLYSYLIAEERRLSMDVTELTQSLRYRKIDTVDCIELMLAQERFDAFRHFSKDIRNLLKVR